MPLLGAAGLSLSMVSGSPAATVGPTAHEITLGEEEISDVSLATFYVFERKTSERPSPAYNLSGTEAATAATPTEAAEAATEAAEAVIEAAAAEVAEAAEAALRFGGVAAAAEAAGGGAIE